MGVRGRGCRGTGVGQQGALLLYQGEERRCDVALALNGPRGNDGPGDEVALGEGADPDVPECILEGCECPSSARWNSTPPEAAALGFFGYPITGSGRVVGFWRETTAVAPSESELAADSDMAVDGLLKDYG